MNACARGAGGTPPTGSRQALTLLNNSAPTLKNYAKDRATVGIGAGQMSRVDSASIAARKGRGCGEGAEIIGAPHHGLGGRDDEVIKAADEHGIAMVHRDAAF